MGSSLIDRQAVIDALTHKWDGMVTSVFDVINSLPSAQSDMAENLYPYKCYITDEDGLQHEVIHTGDIRRVTGWEI